MSLQFDPLNMMTLSDTGCKNLYWDTNIWPIITRIAKTLTFIKHFVFLPETFSLVSRQTEDCAHLKFLWLLT